MTSFGKPSCFLPAYEIKSGFTVTQDQQAQVYQSDKKSSGCSL